VRWRGWAPWRLDVWTVALAALAVVVDVASAWANLSLGRVGGIIVSPALPLACVVAGRIGAVALGCSRTGLRAWREFGAVFGGTLLASVVLFGVEVGETGEAVGLVVAAAGEELVFRLCVLVVAGAVAARLAGREWRSPEQWGTSVGSIALLVGAIVFSALPGHVVQVRGVASAVPFASLALVLGWVVLRTGAIWPVIVAHALLNLVTVTTAGVQAPGSVRLGLAAATLVALVAGADLAARRTGRLRPVPTVIDLTAA
jgi:hypothetical protein